MDIKVLIYDTLGSTNSEALAESRSGVQEGLCIVARQQTAGRGRYGRVWNSQKDAGLNFSIILRPQLEMQFLPLITLMSGVAVHDMLLEYGLVPDIKWVNDILVDEKKISGILAETAETESGLAVVVGVGINLTSANFPPEISEAATSIEEAAGVKLSPDEAAGTMAKFLSYFYEVLTEPNGPPTILDEWRKRSTYFSGKSVKVITGGEIITGVTDGLEANGALRIARPDGEIAVVQAGDVERLRSEAAG